MPRRAKYKFGSLEFTSQDGVKKHASGIRRKYGIGATVDEPTDISFLSDLISCHVEAETKIGVGIIRFYIDFAPEHGGDCFWIERIDGSKTDFGVPSCIIGVARINRLSLRMAIKPQLDAYKSERLKELFDTFVSDYSGEEFPIKEAVADHEIEFEKIISQFYSARGIDLDTELLTRSVDQKSEPVWRDTQLLSDFLDFHREFPLRLVHWRENLSEIKTEANQALQRTTMLVTDRAPSSTLRAKHGRL